MRNIVKLAIAGQAVWLNYLRRSFITSGELKQVMEDGITGITSSPAIFEKAITHSSDYDEYLRELLARGTPFKEIAYLLAIDDIQRAADLLRPIFEESERLDGYVTFELDPSISNDATAIVAGARHMLATINRANAMVEIPATSAGCEAIEWLVSDGVNVNVTNIFSVEDYEKSAQAYLRGLSTYIESHSVWRRHPASVASVSINQVDMEVDRQLQSVGRFDLVGTAGIALAKMIYGRFQLLFSGSKWDKLVKTGARVQRPKWTRTDPLDFRLPDTFYIELLCAPDTVITMSPKAFNAFKDHGEVIASLSSNIESAFETFKALNEAGINLASIGRELQAKTLMQTARYHQTFVQSVSQKRDALDSGWQRLTMDVGRYQPLVRQGLEKFWEGRTMCRIWALDKTVWDVHGDDTIQGLGWLNVVPIMQENVTRIEQFARSANLDGINRTIFLGTGESIKLPVLFSRIFRPWIRAVGSDLPLFTIDILDTIHPDAKYDDINWEKTLFIAAYKNGGKLNDMARLHHLFGQVSNRLDPVQAGRHFAAITDPGSRLAALATSLEFREIFLNDPNINEGFLALSYYGLIPAALAGIDLEKLLDRTMGMVVNASGCNSPIHGDNVAAQIGVSIGLLALEGRNKLLLILPEMIAPFANWLKYLLTVSLSKAVPEIKPSIANLSNLPEECSEECFIINFLMNGVEKQQLTTDLLDRSGCPYLNYQLNDIYDVGALLFTWEIACAVAAHILKIQPFNSPGDVTSSISQIDPSIKEIADKV